MFNKIIIGIILLALAATATGKYKNDILGYFGASQNIGKLDKGKQQEA